MSRTDYSPVETERLRTRFVHVGMLGGLLLLAGVLAKVQVLDEDLHTVQLEKQSIRRVRLPAARGTLYDRNGECLARNRPSFCLAVYVEDLRRRGKWDKTVRKVEQDLARLSAVLGVAPGVSHEDIWRHIRQRLALPLLAWRDLDAAAQARWAEHSREFPGIDLYVEPVRTNLYGALAAHVLGYVGRSDPRPNAEEQYHYYLPQMEGKAGVEKAFNAELSGVPGGRLIRVDVSGYRHKGSEEEEEVKLPVAGDDIYLTLDLRIQRIAERVLNGKVGSAVVLDPRNGEILAMASFPQYDLNAFYPSISAAEWRTLNSDEDRPLLNRAVTGQYPPGSTFKPLVAITALENRRVSPADSFDCPGSFTQGSQVFRCWNPRGHGRVQLRKSIEQSCNVAFCQVGLQCGHEALYHMAEAVGFGRRCGVELPGEMPGLLPDAEWKNWRFGEGWRSGDTCNLSIGQGWLLATPLQMAMFVAALANGGCVYRPTVLLRRGSGTGLASDILQGRSAGQLVTRMPWSPETMKVVRGGMLDAVQDENGTGKRARVAGVLMGGKTGTAEYGPRSARRKHAWMIAFVPYDEPRYAISVVVEDAVSGGVDAAPMVRQLVAGILEGAAIPPGVQSRITGGQG